MTKTEAPEIVSADFGDPAHPALLLIMGAMASMLWWPEAFCRKLAGEGLFVIRYDNRDTGLSTKYAPGEPPYTFDDMADDAIRVLDSHGIGKAHVVGMSMGGMVAQLVALKHPSRVISLTVISSSPVGIDTRICRDDRRPIWNTRPRARKSTGRTATRWSASSSRTRRRSPAPRIRSTRSG